MRDGVRSAGRAYGAGAAPRWGGRRGDAGGPAGRRTGCPSGVSEARRRSRSADAVLSRSSVAACAAAAMKNGGHEPRCLMNRIVRCSGAGRSSRCAAGRAGVRHWQFYTTRIRCCSQPGSAVRGRLAVVAAATSAPCVVGSERLYGRRLCLPLDSTDLILRLFSSSCAGGEPIRRGGGFSLGGNSRSNMIKFSL